MVLSYYVYKYPYKIAWRLAKAFGKLRDVVFYCADPLDCEMFAPIQKHLPPIEIVAKNEKTRKHLDKKGVKYLRMPVFPKAVIMARLAAYKFPEEEIVKIGFGHGLYQFKRWSSNENFNMFDVYFLTSEAHVKAAEARGIASTKAIGFPKLDKAFDGTYDEKFLNGLKEELKLDKTKPTIFFSTTWGPERLSAIDKWIDRIEELADEYNILVTAHTWVGEEKIATLKSMQKIRFIEDYNVIPYIMISDVFVGDYSSIIGEATALGKPIITFKVSEAERSVKEIHELIKKISVQINEFDELRDAIKRCLENPDEKKKEREEANKIFFLALDGQAGKRAAEEIKRILRKNGIKLFTLP